MRLALAVARFGGLGSVLRWVVGLLVQRPFGATFPAGTFVVNALGSFAIGVAAAVFAARGEQGVGLRVAVISGFMGGFTTMSSFAFETVTLLERRSYLPAAVNVIGTLTICFAGCALGLWVGRLATR
jgi:CrcB protein